MRLGVLIKFSTKLTLAARQVIISYHTVIFETEEHGVFFKKEICAGYPGKRKAEPVTAQAIIQLRLCIVLCGNMGTPYFFMECLSTTARIRQNQQVMGDKCFMAQHIKSRKVCFPASPARIACCYGDTRNPIPFCNGPQKVYGSSLRVAHCAAEVFRFTRTVKNSGTFVAACALAALCRS